MQQRSFGVPGAALSHAAYGRYIRQAGTAGERVIARILDELTRDHPEIRVYHSVRIGGRSDSDHVVLSGDSLIVVDAKMWSRPRSYRYRPTEEGLAFRLDYGDRTTDYEVRTAGQLRRWRHLAPAVDRVELIVALCLGASLRGTSSWEIVVTARRLAEAMEDTLARINPEGAPPSEEIHALLLARLAVPQAEVSIDPADYPDGITPRMSFNQRTAKFLAPLKGDLSSDEYRALRRQRRLIHYLRMTVRGMGLLDYPRIEELLPSSIEDPGAITEDQLRLMVEDFLRHYPEERSARPAMGPQRTKSGELRVAKGTRILRRRERKGQVPDWRRG